MDRGRGLFSGFEYWKNHEISKAQENGMKKEERIVGRMKNEECVGKNGWKVNEA